MRFAARLVLSFVLVTYTIACTSQVQEWKPTKEAVEDGEVVHYDVIGVVETSGNVVRFDEPVELTTDRIEAVVEGQPYSTSLDEVGSLLIQRTQVHAGRIFFAVLVVGAFVALVIAMAADDPEPEPQTTSSCPFVYSFDGEVWHLDAEPFGGAITAGLERDDFSVLENLREQDGVYRVMLRNEQRETQYNNLMELWVVDHAAGTEVVPGPTGELFAVGDLRGPESATDAQGRDLLPWVSETDERVFESAPVSQPDGGVRDEITMTFTRPAGATSARLVANVATSMWAAEMLRHSLEVRGRSLTDWYEVVDQNPVARELIEGWSRRGDIFDLNVQVEVDGEWVTRSSLRGGGPVINETQAVSLDLTGVTGDEVRLRVRPPVGFWSLNSFALDFEMLPPLSPTVVAASASTPDPGVCAEIQTADDAYYAMPTTKDRAELRFASPPAVEGLSRTVVLHSRGYYRIHVDATGEPDLPTIDRIINEVDGLAWIGVERYAERQMASAGSGN